jgi:hypothetical protein
LHQTPEKEKEKETKKRQGTNEQQQCQNFLVYAHLQGSNC